MDAWPETGERRRGDGAGKQWGAGIPGSVRPRLGRKHMLSPDRVNGNHITAPLLEHSLDAYDAF